MQRRQTRRKSETERYRERYRAKVTKIRAFRLLHINLGLIVFAFIFIYIVVMLVIYFRTTHVTGYEVKIGSLAIDTSARGVAIRTEKVEKAIAQGYINYYASECERVSSGELVYTIDESGKLSGMINEQSSVNSNLSDSELGELKSELVNYQKSYTDSDFRSVYDFLFSTRSTITRITNESLLDTLASISTNTLSGSVVMGRAHDSGIVVYSTDGLEDLDASNVTASTFDESQHSRILPSASSLLSVSENAFKIITQENWSIVVPWNESWVDEFKDGRYVKVRFLKNGYEAWAKINALHNADGEYLRLDFTNSMITFASDRYLDIELESNEKKGLKIPNTAIDDRDFYLIPKDFLTKGGSSDSNGFWRESYLENGGKSTEFVEAEVYDEADGNVYIDTSIFSLGDVIVMPEGSQTYTVSQKAKLTGVYNMNNGYADFRKINVIYSNKEYSIVESGTMYGLNVYDHIVLDGSSVNDDDFVFEQRK